MNKYMNNSHCVERLVNQYKYKGYIIVAFDFDDTVYKDQDIIDLLRDLQENVCCKLILYTCRAIDYDKGTNLLSALNWCQCNGIVVNYVNIDAIPEFQNLHHKIYYDILLDDKAGLGQAYEILSEFLDRVIKNNL